MTVNAPARAFAVLIPILDGDSGDRVLLTERHAGLPRYAGHVSLPGGAPEPHDTDLRATALRETHEEVGIPPESVDVFAELPWFEGTPGDRVLPFAGRVLGAPRLVANPSEVARVLLVPVALLREDPFRPRGSFRDSAGRSHTIYAFPYDGVDVWGLTARILRYFFVEHPRAVPRPGDSG